jgi:hypothetical protein
MTRLISGVSIGFAVALIASCGEAGRDDAERSSSTRAISGSLVLRGEDGIAVGDDGDTCAGKRGFDDLRQGTEVVVRNGKSEVLARGELGPGEVTEHGLGESFGEGPSARECTFSFVVAEVPDAPFYAIAVGGRGELTYSRADMVEREWRVEFTID